MPDEKAKAPATPAKAVDVTKTPEYKKLAEENAKLKTQLENKAKALKGKETQITNLKAKLEKGTEKKMHLTQH